MRRRLMVSLIVLAALLLANVPTADAFWPVPPPVAARARYTISGVVWQDYCLTDCTAGSSLRRGNGVPDEAEVRLAGVTVGLGKGICRGGRATRFTTTDSQGRYSFGGLTNGVYCVTVNSRQSNTAFPKPGVWTRPSGRSSWYIASYTVIIHGASRGNLNFGWDLPS